MGTIQGLSDAFCAPCNEIEHIHMCVYGMSSLILDPKLSYNTGLVASLNSIWCLQVSACFGPGGLLLQSLLAHPNVSLPRAL